MRRSGKGSGGGAGMNKNVSPAVKYGQPARGRRHEAVAQIGSSQGNKATERARTLKSAVERFEGAPRPAGGGAMLGNEVAKNVQGGGPGKGRVLYGQAGSQGVHGPVAQGNPTPTRDILSSVGPESKR
jgi:hypothetical protein